MGNEKKAEIASEQGEQGGATFPLALVLTLNLSLPLSHINSHWCQSASDPYVAGLR